MVSIDALIDEIRALSPDEIRQRLTLLESEQKTLRRVLRLRLTAAPELSQAAAISAVKEAHR